MLRKYCAIGQTVVLHSTHTRGGLFQRSRGRSLLFLTLTLAACGNPQPAGDAGDTGHAGDTGSAVDAGNATDAVDAAQIDGSTSDADAAMLADASDSPVVPDSGPATGTIRDVRHVVIFVQENRSFDHYLG